MDKKYKIKEKEREIRNLKSKIDKRKALLASNVGKINVESRTIRRLEAKIGIHKHNLKDLENYKRKEEPQKVREEGQIRKLESEIGTLKREIDRDKIRK